MTDYKRLETTADRVHAKRPDGKDTIEARAIFTVECPECDDGHTITFDTIQKTVQCQGGCGTAWRLEI